VRAAVMAGRTPSLSSMVDLAPVPEDGTLYMVYGEFAAVLLRSILHGDRHRLDDFIKDFDPKTSDYEALFDLLPETARSMSPDAWFQRRLELAGIWHLLPSDYDYAEAQLASLQTISILAPAEGGVGQIKTLRLEDLDEDSLGYFHSSGAFNTINYKLQQLQTTGPPLMRPSAVLYVKAISQYKDGDISKYRKTLVQAREESAAAAARGRAILDLLDLYEYGPGRSPHLRLARYSEVILGTLGPSAYETAVTNYLDDLEKRAAE
jgi:hypothetical protein